MAAISLIISFFSLVWKLFVDIRNIIAKTDPDFIKADGRLRNEFGQKRGGKKNLIFQKVFHSSEYQEVSIFYKGIKFQKVADNGHYREKKNYSILSLACNSFLLTGEAGIGKSTIMYFLFSVLRPVLPKTYALFFSSVDINKLVMDSAHREEIVKCLNTVCPKKVVLYFDGIDEVDMLSTPTNRSILHDFINKVFDVCPNTRIRATCRPDFASKNSIVALFKKDSNIFFHYEVVDWVDSKDLPKLCNRILHNSKFSKLINRSKTYRRFGRKRNNIADLKTHIKAIRNDIFNVNYLNSPFLLVLYLHLIGEKGSNLNETSLRGQYNLINACIRNLFDRSGVTSNEKEEKEWLKTVFSSYKTKGRLFTTDVPEYVVPITQIITKNSWQPHGEEQELIFTHRRFYEFFVAEYYINVISSEESSIQDVAYVLSTFYTNDVADLITSYIRLLEDDAKRDLRDWLISLYKNASGVIVGEKHKPWVELDREGNLYFKNEIVSRLGRMFFNEPADIERVLSFFRETYFSISVDENSEDLDNVYLKRWIAVGESYSGGTVCELDYIRRAFEGATNNPYDLANRSYTLIYYGDASGGLLSFRDLDLRQGYEKAITKRWNRLLKKTKFTKPIPLFEPNEGAIKASRFRPFDLITVYTFYRSRSLKMSREQIEIIRKLDFSYFNYVQTNGAKEVAEFLHTVRERMLNELSPISP